jgi:ATP/maltotriose-dependent transcriptional regulator MalT
VRQVRVRRPRLLGRLDGIGPWRLTLLSAPAGWGKTTVLADWYEERPGGRDTWLTLDAADNDPTRFWTGVVAALRRIVPDVGGRTLASLGLAGTGNASAVLAPLVNDLVALAEPLTLVLDDYHVIVNHDIHSAVEYLVDNAPATLRLVLAGRSDPPLPLSRLRARGELCELRERDLFFTRPDTEAFLNEVLRLGLATADVTTLWERGDVNQADRCAESALAIAEHHGLSEHWATTMARVAHGRVLELQGRAADACAAVDRARELAERGIASVEMTYAAIELAHVRRSAGDPTGARVALADARIAAAACPQPGILTDMVERAARTRGRTPRGVPQSANLTDRERALLRLLPGPLRRDEIAAALHVSVNTVKTQIGALYTKLGVSSRTDAVARARQLELL